MKMAISDDVSLDRGLYPCRVVWYARTRVFSKPGARGRLGFAQCIGTTLASF